MTLVKICGITNVEDALAAIEAGASLLGFNFYAKSPRCVTVEDARRIIEQLPETVLCVGVFVNEDVESVESVASASGVGAVQLHGDETPEFCARLRQLSKLKTDGGFIIKALRVSRDFSVEDAARFGVEAVLLDAYARDAWGGTGRTFDWEVARRARAVVPKLILAGGLTAENVTRAVETVRPYAVDVCSGVENAPGRKSFQLMRSFVEAVRAAEGERMKDEG
jgi:phosphoribosylanthranilate isomerase